MCVRDDEISLVSSLRCAWIVKLLKIEPVLTCCEGEGEGAELFTSGLRFSKGPPTGP